MYSTITYKQAFETLNVLFGRMSLPAEGMSIAWLASVKAAKTLVDEMTERFGTRATDEVVKKLEQNLSGSGKAAWAISAQLAKHYDYLQETERMLARFDDSYPLDVHQQPVVPTTAKAFIQ